MLPDNDALNALLATSTPSPWEWFAADGDIMLVPNDYNKLPIMSVVARKGSNEYYLDFHNPLTDKMDDGRDVCEQNSNAKLIALAPALAAEVIRLRELVNPSTPEGKLNQWKAAEELRKNRPKAATAWEPTERKGWWMRRDVHGVGIALAGDCGDFFADTSGRESSGEPSLDTAKKAADEALKAAGWELVE